MTLTHRLCLPLMLVASVAAAAFALPGCTRPPSYQGSDTGREAVNPWQDVVAQLRKENDPAGARRILSKLNNDLAQKPDAPQPGGLTPEAEKSVRELLRLRDEEVKEVRSASFSGLDPVYLASCLYVRDAARGLDVVGLPPGRQAELAFAWVCRQVVLHPWVEVSPQGQTVTRPPVPPTAVLRRGSGSGLERAYVLLAVLQQLDLDGVLVGLPESADRDWTYRPGKETGSPRGPFWAVGVRAGADVLLFDPWRGEPLPGPGGQGVGTLVQVKANPDQLKAWREDKSRPWAVSLDEVKASVPFLAVPLSAVAPRMKLLEQELRSDLPVRLAVDAAARLKQFEAETRVAGLKFWNPPAEHFSYTRVLRSFTPTEEGGTAADNHFVQLYRRSMVPPTIFAMPTELAPTDGDVGLPEVVDRVQGAALGLFEMSFLTPPTPREQVQRGLFQDVTPRLVDLRQQFGQAQDRVRQDQDRGLKEWSERARDVFARLARAREQERTNPTAVREAQLAVNQFLIEGGRVFEALVGRVAADAGLAESTYLLAQCKHEQAEQLHARSERLAADPKQKAAAERAAGQAMAAWQEAKGWWDKYEPFAPTQDRAYPGRAEHAKRLAERAAARSASGRLR